MTDRIGSIGSSKKVEAFAEKRKAKRKELISERKMKQTQIESRSKKILIQERKKRI